MGVDPATGIVILGVISVAAYLEYLKECEREEERRRRQEENCRRSRRDAKRREKERKEQARREEKREYLSEEESEEDSEEERERRERDKRRHRRYTSSYPFTDYNYRMENTSEYYPPPPYSYYNEFEREPLFSNYGMRSPEKDRNQRCDCCNPEPKPPITENTYFFNPFESKKHSVSVTIKPPKTTQDKNQNVKNQGSNNRPSSSKGLSTRNSNSSGSASKQNTKSEPSLNQASTSGSQQPQRNNNNDNNNNNKKDALEDYGKLNDFIKKLKVVLELCKVSTELQEKIMSFFKKFEKHEENFLRLIEDFRIQNIAIEDILSIVIKLFQSDYFANDVAYENFIALMEIVAKYIKDELFLEMVEDGCRGNKKPFEQQREDCMKKVLQRDNILTKIKDLFEEIRKAIVEDNTNQPLEPDFSGIFAKVYHYFKHKIFRGKVLTVKEYFDWIRTLLTLLKGLNPEYEELTNENNTRREIIFEVYSETFRGYFRIVVRAYGSILKICTFFLKEKYDKKAKDGDKRVDGEKKP